MFDEQIERIKLKLDVLAWHDPQGEALFGATEHQYQLNPPASTELLQRFEAKNQLTLPEGYRQFLLHVGNGGAGPYYGLHELTTAGSEDFANADKVTNDDGCTYFTYNANHPQFNKVRRCSFSSLPQHLGANWHEDLRTDKNLRRDRSVEMEETALTIASIEYNTDALLVVEGPFSNQVWCINSEALFDSGVGFWPQVPEDISSAYNGNPFHGNGKEGLTFLDWYEHWLNAGLKSFDIAL